jgi:hypothetical protein
MKLIFSTFFVIACVLLLTSCGEDSQTWRQKLRVVVSTPTGDVSGEAVSEGFIKVLGGTETLGRGAGVGGGITHGEATVVDLGDGRYLFALLDGHSADESWYLPFFTLLNGFPSSKWKNYVEAAREFVQVSGPHNVPSNHYPLLVTFGDVSNSKSVKEVNPTSLVSTFGEGYYLKSITLEITDDSVTKGEVERILVWTQDNFDKRLDGRGFGTVESSYPFANSLASGNFSTWRK